MSPSVKKSLGVRVSDKKRVAVTMRKSARKTAVSRKSQPSRIIHHQLFLQPTLERQRKKRIQREREQQQGSSCANIAKKDNKKTSIRESAFSDGKRGDLDETAMPDTEATMTSKAPRRKMSAVTPELIPRKHRVKELKARGRRRDKPEKRKASEVKLRKITRDLFPTNIGACQSEGSEERANTASLPQEKHIKVERTSTASLKQEATEDVLSSSGSSMSNKDPQGGSRQQLQERIVNSREILIASQRQRAVLEYMVEARTLPTLCAALATVRNWSKSFDFPCGVLNIILEAQRKAEIFLTQIFLEKIALPSSFGGLGYDEIHANFVVPHVVGMVAPLLMNDTVLLGAITPESLAPAAHAIFIQVLPTVMFLIAEVRVEYIALSKMLLSIGVSDAQEAFHNAISSGCMHGFNLVFRD